MDKKKNVGQLEESLINEIDLYLEKINEHRPKRTGKIKRIDLVRNCFTEILANKTLDNKGIKLDKFYYYNVEDLIKKSKVKATTENSIADSSKHRLIRSIPNNLDSWSTEHNTYCYNNNPKNHKGIEWSINHDDILKMHCFEYYLNDSKLTIEAITPRDLKIHVLKAENNEKLKITNAFISSFEKIINETTIQYKTYISEFVSTIKRLGIVIMENIDFEIDNKENRHKHENFEIFELTEENKRTCLLLAFLRLEITEENICLIRDIKEEYNLNSLNDLKEPEKIHDIVSELPLENY